MGLVNTGSTKAGGENPIEKNGFIPQKMPFCSGKCQRF